MVLRKTADPDRADAARPGAVVAEMHEACTRAAMPGATTADLDAAARDVLDRRGARSNFLGYHGFPAVACISPNEVIVHGIPGDRVLEDGDIVSIDCGAIIEGWHADAAITVPVGEVDAESQRLIDVTRAALEAGHRGDRRRATGSATSAPRSSGAVDGGRLRGGPRVRRPRHRHRDARGARGPELRARRAGACGCGPGMVLAIEPMVTAGRRRPPGRSTTAGPS